jgi:hypothetical protein
LRDLSDPVSPQFLYAGESPYDWELESYQLSYIRSADEDHIPLSRYLRPDVTVMTALTGFDHRNMVNQCLLYRYVISYEPFNFKGRLPDIPKTVEYGMQMDRLRGELRAWLWDATFQDTVGAEMQGSNALGTILTVSSADRTDAWPSSSQTTIITTRRPSRRESPTGQSSAAIVSSMIPSWRDVRDGIILPPRSAAVVLPN